jgi:hypothetical protein
MQFIGRLLALAGFLVVSTSASSKDHYFGSGSEWGKLKTKINPGRAAVYVDGTFVGHADQFDAPWQEIYLNPGEHEVRFSIVYYKDYSTRVTIQAKQTAVVEKALEPSGEQVPRGSLGVVKLRTSPYWHAAVLVNGRFIAHTDEVNGPGQRIVMEPGTYEFQVVQAGYKTFETTVTVEAGKTTFVEANLEPDGSGKTVNTR